MISTFMNLLVCNHCYSNTKEAPYLNKSNEKLLISHIMPILKEKIM